MTVIDLFSDASDRYAAARPRYPRRLYQLVKSFVNERDRPLEGVEGDRVWDCGAGNGQASVGLAEFFSDVYATDVSPQQIAHAVACANVIYSVQAAEATDFSDRFFDAVVVAQALHWFDFDRFWPEVIRVLKPGGIFAAWGYDWFSISPEIDSIISHDICDVVAPFWSSRVHYLWAGYTNIPFPFKPIEPPPMEMQVYWRLADLLAYVSTWSAVRACMRQQGSMFFDRATKKLEGTWGNPAHQKTATMRLHLVVGRNCNTA